MENETNEKNNKIYGLGIASFVLSILSIVTLCYVVFSIVFAVLAVILGVLSCIIERKNGMGISGLVIGAISLLITAILYFTLGVLDIQLLYVPDYYKNLL